MGEPSPLRFPEDPSAGLYANPSVPKKTSSNSGEENLEELVGGDQIHFGIAQGAYSNLPREN